MQKLRFELGRESCLSGARDFRRSSSTEQPKQPYDAYDKEGENEREKDQARTCFASNRMPNAAVQGSTMPHSCVQVEQVLETYFMNLDNTYNKLQTLREYIDDTEDYVRFEIDTQRNRFIEVCCKECGSQSLV